MQALREHRAHRPRSPWRWLKSHPLLGTHHTCWEDVWCILVMRRQLWHIWSDDWKESSCRDHCNYCHFKGKRWILLWHFLEQLSMVSGLVQISCPIWDPSSRPGLGSSVKPPSSEHWTKEPVGWLRAPNEEWGNTVTSVPHCPLGEPAHMVRVLLK